MIELEQLCQSVISCAKDAGSFIREQRKTFSHDAVEYKGLHDLVSYVDKTSEKMIVQQLQTLLPEAGFITEENTASSDGQSLQWIIDPLDGTTNFVHGLPCYCVSIGLAEKGKVILGVIYEINLDECFYAWKNGGAYLNGKKISVSTTNDLNKALMVTGFPYSNYTRMKPYMEVFDYCLRNTHGLRRLGSAAVDLAYVAAGRAEGFYEYGLNAWDVAAGISIVEEAGGIVTDFSGAENYLFGNEIIATNKGIQQSFLKVITGFFGRS